MHNKIKEGKHYIILYLVTISSLILVGSIQIFQNWKRMLIVNGFCDMPLNERLEDVFPQQMLKYCVSRGHVLLTSTQLLCLYIEVCKNPICKEERITELLSCVGKYERYRETKDYLK